MEGFFPFTYLVVSLRVGYLKAVSTSSGVCPGLAERWLHKGALNLQNLVFNIYAQTVFRIPCRQFILCKVASKTKHFILADILVLVSEF